MSYRLVDRKGKDIEDDSYPFETTTEALVRLLWTQVPGAAAKRLYTLLGLTEEEGLEKIESAYKYLVENTCPYCGEILPKQK